MYPLNVTVFVLLASLVGSIPANIVSAKPYEANWESIDSRETPQWYPDAKFGIFIHWGLYSVPAFSTRGTYAEWYWHAKEGDQTGKHQAAISQGSATRDFHNRVYGEDFEYADFRPLFTCEMYDADPT